MYVSTVATLAALHIVLSFAPPPVGFRRISIIMEPLEGIIAGPSLGFIAALIGWAGGRFARPDSFLVENLFGVAEAIGAAGAGFLITRRWYLTLVIFGGQLLIFLFHPLTRCIPLWTLWDTYIGFLAILPASHFVRRLEGHRSEPGRLVPAIALIALVAVELDVMVRVFMLIVGGLYQVYPIPLEALPAMFIAGAIQTPLETAYTMVATTTIGIPVLMALEKSKVLRWPLS